ncbi:MAG TPA: hypothetical protein VLM79_25480 [Kofleriaceae bacterium]|nr:hypothetical protein [Kofleriaceae bacterium]
MNLLVRSTVLVFAMTGCFLDHSDDPDPGTPGGNGGGGNGGGSNGGGGPRPIEHGDQTMSDVHAQPGGEQVWIIHSAVADVHAATRVTTAHFGAYVPAQNQFIDVLDTTGTLGKRILFPTKDRVLLVAQRGENQDVFVSIDTVTHRPLAQRSYPGDHTNFRVSPSGRALTATSMAPALELIDTQSLVLQPLPATTTFRDSAWASQADFLYVIDLQGDLTRLQRFDLRTADLSQFGPVPERLSTVPGTGYALAISPDDHFAAIALRDAANVAQVTLLDLTVANPTPITVPCDALPVFTSDNRLVVWQPNPDHTHDLRLITPATGAATAPLTIEYQLPPATIPLRSAPALLAQPFPFEDKPPFLYNTTTGARTPLTGPLFPSSWFERPGHNELWLWEEYEDTLSRLDLNTGAMTEMLRDVDSVDFRAATDDIIVGTFDHSVFHLSMATGAVTSPFILADPNEVAAPFKLATD